MTRIAIVGGHGAVAQHLITALHARGDHAVALVRSESHRADLETLGAEVRLLDLEQDGADRFVAAFEGCDAVVFAAGAGPDGDVDRKRTVDLEGSLKSVEGARGAGIDRFVQVSAIGVDQPLAEDVEPVWRAYVEAKATADSALRDSDLDWTIIRPGRLTDDAATGQVTLAEEVERGDVTRADVAAVVAACLADPGSIGWQWELVGGSTPVTEAVTAAITAFD